MAQYFQRVYQLDITLTDGLTRTFDGFTNDPLQITFQIDQTPNAERSYAQITIYGVNRETRRAVYERADQVVLVAGWRDQYGEIFKGDIENVEIGRTGPDTFIRLYCQSGVVAFEQSTVFDSFGAGTSQETIIRSVAESFGFPVELIGDFSNLPPAIKGQTFASDSKSIMRKLSRSFGFTWSIINNRTYVIKDEARRDAPPVRYTPANGIIGSPEINAKFGVDIDVLLNPIIRPWDQYTVESETAALSFNGIFYQPKEFPQTIGESLNEVVSLSHEGDFYSDTWQTSIKGVRVNE